MKKPPNKSNPSKPGRKRSFPQRDAQLIKINELHIQGFSQYEIAEKMGLSQPQICRDLQEISRRLAPEETDKPKLRRAWLEENGLMKKKLWIAFEKSTEDKEVQTKKQIAVPKGGDAGSQKECMEASLRSEGQCGNPTFISELGKCLDREAKMHDLYPAQKLEHKAGDDFVPVSFIAVRTPANNCKADENEKALLPPAAPAPPPESSESQPSPAPPSSEFQPPAVKEMPASKCPNDSGEEIFIIPSRELKKAVAQWADECDLFYLQDLKRKKESEKNRNA
jgi:hypothetical protein